MRWLSVARVIVGLLVILVATGALAQPPDDLDDSPADSLGQADPGDAGMEGGEDMDAGEGPDTEMPSGEPDRGEPVGPFTWSSWFLDTRPRVEMAIDREKDVANWDTKINLSKVLGPKVRFNLGATLHTQENSTLNRSDSNDGTSASLKYQLNEGMGFNLRYNSTVAAYRYNLKAAEPADRRKKQNVSVGADLNRDLTSALGFHLGINAGTTRNSYASVSNEGSEQDLSTSLDYVPMDNLKATVNYNAKRMLLDSRVDSSGTSVFSSTDRTFSQDLGFSIKYDVAPGVNISADASRSDSKRQNPDPARKEQETEKRSSKRMGLSTSFDLVKWATWSVSADLSESRAGFVLQNDRDNFIRNGEYRASAKLLPWWGAVVNLGAGFEDTRSEYRNPETGRDLHKSVSLKLTQDLGPKADLGLTMLSDIASVIYDDKDANPKDRDRLNNRVSMDFDYQPTSTIKTRLSGEYSEDQTSYMRAERSASNRTNTKYRLSGGYDVKTFYKTSLSQDYDISSVYSSYQFAEDNNTLIRNSNVRTDFRVPLARGLDLNLTHNYQFQDQGKYSKRGGTQYYARASEKETHTMGVVCRYAPFRHVDLIVRQNYRVQRTWSYDKGRKSLDYETATSDISGRLTFTYNIGERTKFALKIEQNRRDGSNVSKAFRNYRNIELEASHVF